MNFLIKKEDTKIDRSSPPLQVLFSTSLVASISLSREDRHNKLSKGLGGFLSNFTPKARREYGCVDENSLAMLRALELQAILPPEFPSLVKFMLHSRTASGFWLGLPKEFCTSHLTNHDACILLVDENGKERETMYLGKKHRLSAGWKGFSVEHNLVAGDVLVFHLIEPLKIKVYIVREIDSTNIEGAINLQYLSRHSELPIATVDD